MPPTQSLFSEYSADHLVAFNKNQATVISNNSAWFQGPLSPSSDLYESSGQSNHGHSSKCSIGTSPPTIHTFSLPVSSNSLSPMTVNLHSWASSSTSTPAYVEGQCISGQVQLNLRTPDRIKAVTLSVEGYYSIPGFEAKTFLHVSETLWDSTMGDPRSGGMILSRNADHSGKLHGRYSWSFKIECPKTLEMSAKEEKQLGSSVRSGERLPPSLRGSLGQARIGYEIVVRIKRPGFRFGNSLTIPITYMIATHPSPGSLHRRVAYQNETPVPSLFDDPSGWKVYPEFPVDGSYYRSPTLFTCVFALASPVRDMFCMSLDHLHSNTKYVNKQLSYARASFIPCMLVLSSSCKQVLEAVSKPSAPQVILRRRLVLHSDLGGELALDGQEQIISKASWMCLDEPTRMLSGFRRTLQGEINIPPTVIPSFAFGRLELKYDVLVLPFDAPGLTLWDSGHRFRSDVVVTTFQVDETLPIS